MLLERLSSIEEALEKIEGLYSVRISHRLPVSGGDINATSIIILDNGQRFFLKQNRPDRAKIFQAETRGLLELARLAKEVAETSLASSAKNLPIQTCIRIPRPLAWGSDTENSFLLMEEIQIGQLKSPHAFGAALARLHRAGRQKTCGWPQDNWLGTTLQINKKHQSWYDFFIQERLLPQWELARQNRRLTNASRDKNFQSILKRIPELLPPLDDNLASLLHGDLWGGNWLADTQGRPCLIDPAVYYGHREADLAMTHLFGGFPHGFHEGYMNEWPLSPGFSRRIDLYNLYHLLNHLNLFGSSYLTSVQSIIRQYT